MKDYLLSLIVPVFNEQEVLPESYARMKRALDGMSIRYEIIYVDDGSKDKSWKILNEIAENDDRVVLLKFSRNFGHQLAVTAGMQESKGDCVVVIDVDLQDPPEVIPEMVEKWLEGYEVVYGKRKSREGETKFKLFTAKMYYKLLTSMSAYPIPLDTGDFRLLDRKVVDVMNDMPENNRFLRGLSSWAGFTQTPVEYERHARVAGQTHYTFKKMLKLAADGIFGFSKTPLDIPTYAGISLFVVSCFALIAFIILEIVGSLENWLWGLLVVLFLFSALFIFIGVLGTYISRVFDEVRQRPLYIVSQSVDNRK